MDNFQPLLDYINRVIELTEEEEQKICSLISYRKLLKGQYFLQQGDVCKFSGFVVSGCTKTFFVDEEGQEHIVMFSVEDWWTSDMGSYISQKPADFNVQCLENTTLFNFLMKIRKKYCVKFQNWKGSSGSLLKELSSLHKKESLEI